MKVGDNNHSACDGIPRHTLIKKSLIETKERARSEIFHNYVINVFGDTDVKKEW